LFTQFLTSIIPACKFSRVMTSNFLDMFGGGKSDFFSVSQDQESVNNKILMKHCH